MILKVAPFFLMALLVGAEKKIELQDIEEDNLKSENEKDYDHSEPRSQSSGPEQGQGLVPLEYLKSGIFNFFANPTQAPQQQQRYVHQYAVTEQPERPVVVTPKAQYGPPSAQQAMVGYLSNVPMQIYLVPQYYNEHSAQSAPQQNSAPYSAQGVAHVPGYQNSPEAVQTQTNYIEVPTYVTPTGKTYIQQYTPPVTYVSYSQPTIAPPQPTVAPVLTYQMPVVQYPTAIVQAQTPTSATKTYYHNPRYTETNTIEEVHEHQEESPKHYSTHTEVLYNKAPSGNDYQRFYPTRTPHDYRHSSVSELPAPNPLLLKSPPHLSHIPKVLPMYRPLTKPVYTAGIAPGGFSQRPNDAYGPPFKRRPTSLLDSYIPSSVQLEYLKKGFARDPLEAYEALSSGRHFSHSAVPPRHFERGFLPNQMYHTGAGGVTFGHYKRSPKLSKSSQN